MLDGFIDNLFEQIEEESFEIDSTLLDMGIDEEQQRAIHNAKKEILNKYNDLKTGINKNYVRIKKEIREKISEIEDQNTFLLEENEQLKNTIAELQQKVNMSLTHKAGAGVISQLKELENLTIQLASALYSIYTKPQSACDEKDKTKESLINFINYSNYYLSEK